MKRQYAIALLTLILTLGVAAEGQLRHYGFVDVPFEFLAAGKTLPAGTYRIGPLSGDGLHGLMLSNYESRSGVYVLPVQFEASPSTKVKLSFEQIGEMHVLNSIETADGVYLIHPFTPTTALTNAKRREGTASSGAQ